MFEMLLKGCVMLDVMGWLTTFMVAASLLAIVYHAWTSRDRGYRDGFYEGYVKGQKDGDELKKAPANK